MPGRGPAPKDPSRSTRGKKGQVVFRVIEAQPVAQPPLPDFQIRTDDGLLIDFEWPQRTRDWWRMWGESPLSADYIETDWSELLDAAILHARYWSGDIKVAGELRLRVSKFGPTPEDRARLRIQLAQADTAEKRADRTHLSARERFAPITNSI